MELNMSKGKTLLFLITLFLTNIAVMADMVIIPAADGLFSTFENVGAVNFILSGPALINVFSALMCGKLMQYFSKKTLLVAGFAIFTVSSIFGVAVESLSFLITMRILVGAAMGIINATAMALIAEIYVDETKRGTIMGIFNASMAGIGAVIGLIAGYFAVESWQSVFKVYWISVPVLVLTLLFLPYTAKEGKPIPSEETNTGRKNTYIMRLVMLSLSCIALNVIYGIVYYQIALYVAERNIGNESVAGILSSLGTVGSCIACMLFGFTYSKLKRGTIIPTYLLLILCYILLYFTNNTILAGIACTLMGSAFGNGFSYFFLRCTVIVPPEKTSFSVSVITAVGGFGMFLSTYAATLLQKLTDSTTISAIIPLLIGASIVAVILSVLLTIRNNKLLNS